MTQLANMSNTLPATVQADAKIAAGFIQASKSAATRRAYASDWSRFSAYCKSHAVAPLPASPDLVASFIASEAGQGLKPSTVGRRLAAIRLAHELAGHDSPTGALAVTQTMAGIRRTLGAAPQQKAAATADKMQAMLANVPDTLTGLRDRAVLALGFAGAFRRSELVALTVEDLEFSKAGLRVTIRRSKTDQEGAGQVVAILDGPNLRVASTLRRWLEAAKIEAGPLFRQVRKGGRVQADAVSCRTVANIVKQYAASAGLDADQFSGHSLRAGFLTSAAEHGAGVFKMMEVSRHKSVNVLKGYVRRAELFTDHAGAQFL